jgi:hypothetical protein
MLAGVPTMKGRIGRDPKDNAKEGKSKKAKGKSEGESILITGVTQWASLR